MKNLAEPVKKQDFTLVRWLLGQVSERVRLFPGCGSEISDVTISIHFPLLSGLTDHVVLSTSERLYWAVDNLKSRNKNEKKRNKSQVPHRTERRSDRARTRAARSWANMGEVLIARRSRVCIGLGSGPDIYHMQLWGLHTRSSVTVLLRHTYVSIFQHTYVDFFVLWGLEIPFLFFYFVENLIQYIF